MADIDRNRLDCQDTARLYLKLKPTAKLSIAIPLTAPMEMCAREGDVVPARGPVTQSMTLVRVESRC